ncbi:MAG: ATP-binding protein, partial [Actinomycetota bacterium]
EADTAATVEAARADLQRLLAGRSIPALADLPECADPQVRALIGIIADAIPAVYHIRPLLYPFLGLTGIILSLRHGVTEDSCAAFSGYSVSLVGRFEEIPTAFAFSELALKLGERFDSTQLRGTLLFRHGYFISPWRRPISDSMPVLDECFRTCLETGNLIYAAYVAYASAWMLFEKGEVLDTVLSRLRQFAPFARNSRIVWAELMIRLQELFVAELQDQLPADGPATAARALAAMNGTGHGYGVAFYHVVRQVTPYLMGRYEEALDRSREAAALWAKISSSVIDASHQFYTAMTMTALYPNASPERQAEFLTALAEPRRKLKLWADNCPQTFASRSLLVEAEMARIDGRVDDAMRLYEDAILAARTNGQLQHEAIANERAAGFCRERGLRSIAEVYLRNARWCFRSWGAVLKVRQLDEQYPDLADGTGPAVASSAATFSGNADGLDLTTVIKAQQAVSGEIVLGKLVESLLRIVVEHAGADRGLLILPHGDGYRIEAEAVAGGDAIRVDTLAAAPSPDLLPLSVFHYVTRARERVVLDNAGVPNIFDTADYARRRGAKAVLCLPVVTGGTLRAVVYLENSLAAGAFTRGRVAVLDLLAAQAAISLENATLYAEMEERVRERTQELARSLETVRAKSAQVSALLDNSGQGFLSFGADLVVAPEYSNACLAFFDGPPAGRPIGELLFPGDERARATLAACVAKALGDDDAGRRELYLSLLPGEVGVGGKILEAEYKAVGASIMLVLTDVTDERALAAQVAREQRRLEMIVTAVTAGNDFFDVIAEFRTFVDAGGRPWERRDGNDLYRTVHTFKGSFSQFGFHHLPEALHQVEAALQALPEDADGACAAEVVFAVDWRGLLDGDLATVTMALGEDFMARRGVVTVTPDQAGRFEKLARELIRMRDLPGDVRATLAEMAAIRAISLRQALGEFVKLIRQVATRLDKEVGPLVVEGDDVRVDPEVYGPFLRSLGHVFRNAVDHGIEDPDSRLAAGKNEMGAIRCTVARRDDALLIEIADDGGGIDVEALRRRAARRAGVAAGDWDLAELVFAHGVSARAEASEVSGRGVGMAAVRAAVAELGGTIHVASEPGRGTSFVFSLPFAEHWT